MKGYKPEHYRKNKQKYIEQARLRKERNKKFVDEYKDSHSCLICGEDDSSCLVFHHKNPDEKYSEVSRMVCNGNSIDNILKEIEKCVIICANCHMKLHTYGKDYYKLE